MSMVCLVVDLLLASSVRVTVLKNIRAKPLTGSVLAKFFRQMVKKYVMVTKSLKYPAFIWRLGFFDYL